MVVRRRRVRRHDNRDVAMTGDELVMKQQACAGETLRLAHTVQHCGSEGVDRRFAAP